MSPHAIHNEGDNIQPTKVHYKNFICYVLNYLIEICPCFPSTKVISIENIIDLKF